MPLFYELATRRSSLAWRAEAEEAGSEYSMTGRGARRPAARTAARRGARDPDGRWWGEPVHHHGEHYTVDGMRFLPRPVQRPGVPVWVAGFYGKPRRCAVRPGTRASSPPKQLAEIVADLTALRTDPTAPFDVVAALPSATDPTPYAAAGATW
jgi:alkanesulfonate monooxygenase SsuD/methylene tetrahydromethanopterin reductase-like flavin-dependent oxidoreductase (luciferase family)